MAQEACGVVSLAVLCLQATHASSTSCIERAVASKSVCTASIPYKLFVQLLKLGPALWEISLHTVETCDPWCTCRFQLLNHRADMQFVMVTNLTSWLGGYDMIARSPIIKPKNPNEPLQGHLARTEDPR